MSDTQQLRSFGLIVGGYSPLLGYGRALAGSASTPAVLIALALVVPRRLTQVYRFWMTVGEVLGWINTRLILAVLFYGRLKHYWRFANLEPLRLQALS